MTTTEFLPARWLTNPHMQSVMASLGLRRLWVRRRARALLEASRDTILQCPDGVRLHGIVSRHADGPVRPMAVLIHGWEGSADSLYLMSAAGYLFEHGYDVFRLHLRDHGPSHHLNEELFHSCRIDEAVDAVSEIQRRFPDRPLHLAGFSLGGNFSVRIARRAPQAGIRLSNVVAICPVLEPANTMAALERGAALYRFYFVRKWQRSLHLKARLFPHRYDHAEFTGIRSLFHLTDYFVSEHSDFPDIDTYLQGYAITGNALEGLSVETHLILAEDDPIIPVADLARVARPDALRVTTTRHGGHCGYIDSVSGPSWADREILRRFAAADSLSESDPAGIGAGLAQP